MLSFIQALLKTGYYQASHPGSTGAKLALYQEWKKLDRTDKEISFLVQEGAGMEEVFIYGVLSEVTSLKTVFSPTMAELFVPKLHQYFARRHLMSFTIKPEITLEEFKGFVDVMTEIPTSSDPSQIISEMTAHLVDRQIVHVSVVYLEEAPAFQRAMHWMAKAVLTRLGKDLCMIPLYKHLNQGQVAAVKAQIFRELLRPLLNWPILKEIMVNCDQVLLTDETGSGENTGLEEQLILSLRQDQLFGLLLECTRGLRESSPHADSEMLEEAHSYHQRLLSVIRKLVPNLQGGITEGTDEMIETLLEEKVISLKALPSALVSRFLIKKKTEDYLKNKVAYWDILAKGWPMEASKTFMPILSLLLSRDDFHSFGELLSQLCCAFRKTFGTDATFSTITGMEVIHEMVVAGLQARRSAKRKAMLSAIEPSASALFESLFPFCAHEDIWVRRNVCRIVASGGEKIIPGLIAWAGEHKQDWQIARNVVMILGDIGLAIDSVLHFLRRCQQHPELRVREEVINSYGKMRGQQVEAFLLQELEDPNGTLKGRVVLALGHYNTMNERYLSFLSETLRKKRKNEIEIDEAVQVHCCIALEFIAIAHFSIAQSFEPVLCAALMPEVSTLFRFIKKYKEKEYAVIKEICRLLGTIGTETSLPVLRVLSEGEMGSKEDALLVHQAIKKIEQRMGLHASSLAPQENVPLS